MSLTFRVVDGQVEFDPATGQIVSITGERKCSQDLAECLLQDYLLEQDYGSYLSQIIQNKIPYISEMVIRHYIAEAVRVLDARQMEDPAITRDEKTTNILELDVLSDSNGMVGFFLRVGTEAGQSASTTLLQPTQLKQLTEGF